MSEHEQDQADEVREDEPLVHVVPSLRVMDPTRRRIANRRMNGESQRGTSRFESRSPRAAHREMGSVDRDLVEAARNGDREAYVDLIRVRTDRLFAIAQRILRDIDRAEDALQDALVIAWRDLKGLRDPDRFDAWLQRLVINVCIAQATRERRRTANLRLLPVDGPAAPDEFLTIADRDVLERGFRRLPPEQR